MRVEEMRTEASRSGSRLFQLLRLLRTVRYLRTAQIFGRLWRALRRPVRADRSPAPRLRTSQETWRAPCTHAPCLIDQQRVRLLEIEHDVVADSDWNHAQWSRLWLYNLHYFDDLNAACVPARIALQRGWIERWIAANPPCIGVGWEPYPLSLRIVNWIKWCMRTGQGDERMLSSLAVQVRALPRQIEFHLLGNHLWANAKALIFAGSFFAGEEADAWLRKGLAIARRELSEQVLADGGHFERSAMYHSIVLDDVLDLIALARCFPSLISAADLAQWREAVPRMLHWLAVMTHPDGGIALFNDAALGVAPTLAELSAAAVDLDFARVTLPEQKLHFLAASGYARLHVGNAVLIADVAPLGPDYLPGHGHADTLGFELSVHGMRVIVDAGTSLYDDCQQRRWQRGTSAHNTVEIDDCDSSEVWSSFRVGRRAFPFDVSAGEQADHAWLRGAHDGYRWRTGSPVHRRCWRLYSDRLEIEDQIEGNFLSAVARLRSPVDAGLALEPADSGASEPLRVRFEGAARVESSKGVWHPRFHTDSEAIIVTATFAAGKMRTVLGFS